MVQIRLPKCWVLLTEREIEDLLKRDPELWETALKRGKAVMRARARETRQAARRRSLGGARSERDGG